MAYLTEISLRNKLVGIILIVTFFALSIGFIIYTTNSITNLRSDLKDSMIVNAKLVSEYSIGPLIFDDRNGADEILQKLEKIESIEEAYIFDNKGVIFATFSRDGSSTLSAEFIKNEFAEFKGGELLIYQPIEYLNEPYGVIHLKVSTQLLSDKIREQILLMVFFSIIILLLSWFLAQKVQRLISAPLLNLADISNKISEKGDFSIRATKQSEDEIGFLYDQFNGMIERIQRQQEIQKENEDALRMSEEKYRHIFENSMVGIYRYDIENGLVVEANDAAIRILQLDKAPSWNMKNMFQKVDDRKRLLNMLKREGLVDNFETKLKRGDGKMIWVSISGKVYGEGEYYEGVLQDITSNKENYLNLQKANFELDNFVYHTSHDLRSPLLSVLGLVNIAKSETDISQFGVLLEMIEKSIKKLDGLVNDLLVLSRDNRVNDPFEEIDVEQQIHECIENYDFLEQFDRIDIKVNTSLTAPFISDRTRFNVILNNLISNSIKYSRPEINNPFIHISVRVDKLKCVLKVEDNGEGIPKKFHDQIFDMFVRATESSNGSGLGLYIVGNVLEKLGAKIDFESSEGVGTTFTVTIPNNDEVMETKKVKDNSIKA